MLHVTTIFYSIQGEATHTGIPSVFVRLHGCNLDCSFCDDLLHKQNYTLYTFDQILSEISQYPSKQIIITGGEPTINDLNSFILFLQDYGYFVSIETNGYKLQNIERADWITYSPKDWDNIHQEGYNELKFVVNRCSDITKILEIDNLKPIFIQPENHFETPNMDNTRHCIELVQKYPHLRLSIQTHKFLEIL